MIADKFSFQQAQACLSLPCNKQTRQAENQGNLSYDHDDACSSD